MNSWFEFPLKTCRRDTSVFLLPGQGADTHREARVGRHWGLHMEQLLEAVRADQLGPRLLLHRCLRDLSWHGTVTNTGFGCQDGALLPCFAMTQQLGLSVLVMTWTEGPELD